MELSGFCIFATMQIKAATPDEYFANVPEAQKPALDKLRALINAHIPEGFEEVLGYGMPGWVVPHSLYPAGYHCDPKLPLPFAGVAAQKNFIAVYHMGIYADPELMNWFTEAHARHSAKKPDMGKSCLRYKKPEDIPYELIGELFEKFSPQQWIALYQDRFLKSKKS